VDVELPQADHRPDPRLLPVRRLDLIGACDIVFAAEGTLFGHPAARGMGIPVTIGTMPMRIGAAATKELLFTGDLFDAEEPGSSGSSVGSCRLTSSTPTRSPSANAWR
jgi:hypothetical protein